MISKLNHKSAQIASEIHTVFQLSYAVEAALLKAVNFPPLARTIDDFINSNTTFYGYYDAKKLVAVVELKVTVEITHIQSLVVLPSNFRKGIATTLLRFVLDAFDTKTFTVETGLANIPAIALYKKFGFAETKQYDTNHGVRKVALELHSRN